MVAEIVREQCTVLLVPSAVLKLRFHSSQEVTVRFIAASASKTTDKKNKALALLRLFFCLKKQEQNAYLRTIILIITPFWGGV